MPRKPQQKKDAVFDVAKPGTAKPQTGSRPIIVGHDSMMQDPMMRSDSKDSPSGPPSLDKRNSVVRAVLRSNKELTLVPTSSAPNPSDSKIAPKPLVITDSQEEVLLKEPEIQAPETKAASTDKANDTEKDEAQPSTVKPEEKEAADAPSEEDQSSDDHPEGEGIVDELAKQAAAKKEAGEQTKVQAAQAEKIAKLTADKTYFVPIGKATRKRKARQTALTLVLLIIVILAGANFALDAGVINSNVKPLTDIIKAPNEM